MLIVAAHIGRRSPFISPSVNHGEISSTICILACYQQSNMLPAIGLYFLRSENDVDRDIRGTHSHVG